MNSTVIRRQVYDDDDSLPVWDQFGIDCFTNYGITCYLLLPIQKTCMWLYMWHDWLSKRYANLFPYCR